MSRLLRLALSVTLLAAVLGAGALALPERTVACSCLQTGPEQIGTFADEPNVVVFIGTIVSMANVQDGAGHTRGVLAIHLVYKGQIPSGRMPVIGGGGGDCTMSLNAGLRMITAASFQEGVITPGLCMPFGDPDTPEGLALVKAATAAYGPGVAPPDVDDPDAGPTTETAPDPALPIVLGAVIIGTLALFLLVSVVARRTRTAD